MGFGMFGVKMLQCSVLSFMRLNSCSCADGTDGVSPECHDDKVMVIDVRLETLPVSCTMLCEAIETAIFVPRPPFMSETPWSSIG